MGDELHIAHTNTAQHHTNALINLGTGQGEIRIYTKAPFSHAQALVTRRGIR